MVPMRYGRAARRLPAHLSHPDLVCMLTAMSLSRPAAVPVPERLATLGLVAATTAAATFAVLIAGGSGSLESSQVRLAYDLMATLALVPWLVVAALRPAWWPSSRLWPAIVVCLAVFAVSAITSRVPRLSAEMVGYAVLLAELYLLLVALMRRPRLRAHFKRLALLLAVLVCALYLLEVVLAWRDWWGLVGRLATPPLRPGYLGLSLGSPNPVATLVLLLAAFALATAGRRGLVASVFDVLLVALIGVTTLITGSRGAWLGAAAGLVVTGGVALVAAPGSRRQAGKLVRSRWGAGVAAIAVPVALVAGVLAARSGRLTLDDAGYREAFAAASLRMFGSSPLTGLGPGTWQVFRAANETASQPDLYIPHAHNIYWQALAEFGLLGVLAGIVVVACLGLLILHALRSDDGGRRRVALAALFAVILLAVQQVADMLMNVPALLFAMALPIAWLDATAPRDRATRRWVSWPRVAVPVAVRQRSLPLAMAAITCVVAAGLFRMESVTGVEVQAVSAADAGSWADAAALARQAVDADPGLPVYDFTLGVAAANAGDLTLAESALARSAAADDYTYAWLDLAAVRWRQGDGVGARDALTRAERLGRQRATVALPAGWLRQQFGDTQAAISDYVAALATAPTLADDPFWSSTPDLQAEWPAVWSAAQARLGARTRLELDLVAGRLDLAREAAAVQAGGFPALYALVVPAWEGDAAAWAGLQSLAAAHPLDADPVGWCQLVVARHGDGAAVANYGLWLDVLGSPDSGLPQVARVAFGQSSSLPPLILDRYGSLYRRPVPAAQVVGILPQLVWQDHF